ncbi:CLUMA_CG000545, isoform A [Clunio marinus]|uniref:U6 snRNA phosphodiesterase n=1 Tax=Clunio marinus TaxID=568069 RepID=A0A1J1HFE4_9DIPT|nr:CLUMA_CG000545, isoform A [Clunio marinus]
MKNLVDYSSSESDECEKEVKLKDSEKCKRKLPMLLSVSDKKIKNECREDHQMRIRSIPHVEGNWATHVYVDCPLNEIFLSFLKEHEESSQDIHSIESTHVSLSRTFILRYHWIDNFFISLREKLKQSCNPCTIEFSSQIVYYSNEDKTRWFACILVNESFTPSLKALVSAVDSCLNEFNLPVYYENPSFHISVFWKLTEFSDEEKAAISQKIKNFMEQEHEIFILHIEKISCKSGNKLIKVSL